MSLLVGTKDKQYSIGPVAITDLGAIAGIL